MALNTLERVQLVLAFQYMLLIRNKQIKVSEFFFFETGAVKTKSTLGKRLLKSQYCYICLISAHVGSPAEVKVLMI